MPPAWRNNLNCERILDLFHPEGILGADRTARFASRAITGIRDTQGLFIGIEYILGADALASSAVCAFFFVDNREEHDESPQGGIDLFLILSRSGSSPFREHMAPREFFRPSHYR